MSDSFGNNDDNLHLSNIANEESSVQVNNISINQQEQGVNEGQP
jgi:hypothetical protein